MKRTSLIASTAGLAALGVLIFFLTRSDRKNESASEIAPPSGQLSAQPVTPSALPALQSPTLAPSHAPSPAYQAPSSGRTATNPTHVCLGFDGTPASVRDRLLAESSSGHTPQPETTIYHWDAPAGQPSRIRVDQIGDKTNSKLEIHLYAADESGDPIPLSLPKALKSVNELGKVQGWLGKRVQLSYRHQTFSEPLKSGELKWTEEDGKITELMVRQRSGTLGCTDAGCSCLKN